MHETELKRHLENMIPEVHFDLGGAQHIYHPKIERWQGIFIRGRHVGSMDRGFVPKFTLAADDNEEVLKIGWLRTLTDLVSKRVLTWERIRIVMGVEQQPLVSIKVPRKTEQDDASSIQLVTDTG